MTWQVPSLVAGASSGTISARGLYTAPAASAAPGGTFPVIVSVTDVWPMQKKQTKKPH